MCLIHEQGQRGAGREGMPGRLCRRVSGADLRKERAVRKKGGGRTAAVGPSPGWRPRCSLQKGSEEVNVRSTDGINQCWRWWCRSLVALAFIAATNHMGVKSGYVSLIFP